MVMKLKTRKSRNAALVLIFGGYFAVMPVLLAAETSADSTTMKEVNKEVTEAARSIKDYTAEQRDEAVKNAKAAMDDLDSRIDRMETQLDEKWGEMDHAARQQARSTLTELRKQRDEVAEWYGGLKHSSTKAWEDVKKGFVNSFQALGDAFEKAKKEF
jgi:chromosome segregation ATPase